MLLVMDVGNTNTVLGVFERVSHRSGDDVTSEVARYEKLVANWRVGSHLNRTVDEYGVIFRNLFSMDNLEVSDVQGIVIASVVPPLDSVLRQVCERYFNTKPLFIEPGVKTGMPVLYDNPAEVGADRVVNAVAAFEKYGGPCVIVDFGTATTFDCVSKKGEYMGGVISVAERGAEAHPLLVEAPFGADVLEFQFAQIAEGEVGFDPHRAVVQDPDPLGLGSGKARAPDHVQFHFKVESVGDEEVEPAVIVEVLKAGRPGPVGGRNAREVGRLLAAADAGVERQIDNPMPKPLALVV